MNTEMADRIYTSAEKVFLFGPFRLLPAQQTLLDGDSPVRLGSRALEILTALVERPGELLTKSELMARAWPNTTVEESNLKVHIAAVRRALREGQADHRYVATVSGRGYRFIAPVNAPFSAPPETAPDAAAEQLHHLPVTLIRPVGREATIEALSNQLSQHRLITIVGAGGIGKTTIALAVAKTCVANYRDGVWFVDLAPLAEPRFAASTLASALGLIIHSEEPLSALIAYLRDKEMLILFDSCEHVIEEVAAISEKILDATAGLRILATSREQMRARNERVFRLQTLESPPDVPHITAASALVFPAVQLFVERAAQSLDGFALTDADAPAVADICRRLEGVALAIELAATRIDAFGVWELSKLLNDRFRLLTEGRRTALSRHRSLAAALDWSYEYLSEQERAILRRLAIFAGIFTLDAATMVVSGSGLTAANVIEGVATLVAKSLISADVSHSVVNYRLLDTTRDYVLEKLTESGEHELFLRGHAIYFRSLFERAESEWGNRPIADWFADYSHQIDDLRNALNWAFSPGGDSTIGTALTVAAIPLWMHSSLMEECRKCVDRALANITPGSRSERDEMKLYTALGAALLYARGPLPETDMVWTKALHLAEHLADSKYQLRILWGLSIYRVYIGEYRAALWFARKFRSIAVAKGDAEDRLSCDRLIATALHYLGNQASARRRLQRVLSHYVQPFQQTHIARFQFDQRVAARSTLANVLWLQGLPDQAMRMAQSALQEARASDHPLSLYNGLGYGTCSVAIYVGDWATADRSLAILLDLLEKHGLTIWNILGNCLRGTLLVKRGELIGLSLLKEALDDLRKARFGLRYASYLGTLAYGHAIAGHVMEGRSVIEEALAWSERSEERWALPELLRIKGELLRMGGSTGAEDVFMHALDWARRQEALSWELRVATSLFQFWQQNGRTQEARQLLSSVYHRFTEGFDTLDLKIARELLTQTTDSRREQP